MGADMVFNGCGFIIDPATMEQAAIQPRIDVIRMLLSHGARSDSQLTQRVSEAGLHEIQPMLKWSEDPELGPIYFKIQGLIKAGSPEPILPIILSLGPKVFEAILDECRIDPDTGEMEYSSLMGGNIDILLNLIQKCPEEAEVDPSIRVANIKKLNIWIQNDLTSLEAFTELEELEACWASTLAGLSGLHGLKILKCSNPEFSKLFKNPESLSNLHSLEEIDLSENAQLNDLSGLGSLPNLKRLDLSGCDGLTDLRELAHLTGLEELDLCGIDQLEDVTPLANLKNLKSLNLSNTRVSTGIDKVQALGIPDLKLPAPIAPPPPIAPPAPGSPLTTAPASGIENIYPDNAVGKYYIDEECIDCDLCRETSAVNFSRNAAGGYSYVSKQPESKEEEQLCAEALEGCPVESIHADGQDEVLHRFLRIISEQLGTTPDKITLGSRFIEDLGADSLDAVELTMAVEEEFGNEIPDAEVESIGTFGQALAYLRENQNS
jgi:ferredoxin